MEPERKNTRLVHTSAIVPDPEYAQKPLEWFVGRAVKIAFQSADSDVEYMWVLIKRVTGHSLVGTLDNDPEWVTHLKYGDNVTLIRPQITAVNLSPEEWIAEAEKLNAKDDYFNPQLGQSEIGTVFGVFYIQGLTPRQALNRWRNFSPVTEMDD